MGTPFEFSNQTWQAKSKALGYISVNPIPPKGAFRSPTCFSRIIIALSELRSSLLGIHTLIKITHFAENRITPLSLGHVWWVLKGQTAQLVRYCSNAYEM